MLLIKQLKLLVHPKAVWSQSYGGKKVDDQLLGNVLAFCFIYFATIALSPTAHREAETAKAHRG